MRERRLTARPVGLDSGQLLLICAAGMLTVAGIAHTAAEGLTDPRVAIGFGALIAAGELARLTMPGNREVAPISTAASLGYALLLDVGGRPAHHSALQVVAVMSVGMIAGGLPHLAVGRPPRLDALARRLLAGALLAFAYRPLTGPLGELARDTADRHGNWWPALGVMAALVTIMLAADVVIAAMLRADQVRTAFVVAVRDEIRMAAPLGAAVAASGILLALASHSMDMTALPAFAAPLLVTQVAFRKYAGIRATYLQTVRALSRVTEVGGYVEPGHSRRVSQLSVAIGRELGMAEPQLLELEYAALMHDIGQLSLRDPIPGGATVLADPAQARRIAELGAEVIRKTGVLHGVAEIVRRQCDTLGESPPTASRIIKAANAYDDLVGGSTDRDRAAAALERLRLDGGSAYDPGVVEAMARVVDRLVLVTRL
ncbi:HD domain-containing phosphohydrolase [Microbispora sp. NPDC046933]|uniref:HD-GYP domain-containing protein n=1 Tax=Microbispora sp. NPDC046933 TaxID=3155618 RepID=UPI0033C6263D